MGLNFDDKKNETPIVNEQIAEVSAFDIEKEKKELTEKMVDSKEVDDIVSTIDVYDMNSIVYFGAKVAEDISKASDSVLNSMSLSQIDESSKLLKALSDVMDQFDIEEIKEDPSFFGKIFGGLRKQLDKILDKYKTLGDDVDKIYIELKKYEVEIKESNKKLQTIFEANVEYFQELEKYILAGEQAIKELNAHIEEKEKQRESNEE